MKKVILLLVFFILFSVPSFSKELYQYGITAEIFDNNTISYRLNLISVDEANQTFILPLGSVSDVKVESSADCSVQSGTLENNLVCYFNTSNRTSVIVTYVSDQRVDKKDGYFLFSDSFKINEDTKEIPILVKLPEGTGLREPVENSYSPSDALIGSDGRRTIVKWQLGGLRKGDRIEVSIAYEKIGEIIISEIPLQIFFIVVILIVAAAVIFYNFYWKAKSVQVILPILKKDEKKIFDVIMKNGDGVNQKIIVNESGYSKAKVSKVLKSLQERGVLKLERIGRKNKVHINSDFQNKA